MKFYPVAYDTTYLTHGDVFYREDAVELASSLLNFKQSHTNTP